MLRLTNKFQTKPKHRFRLLIVLLVLLLATVALAFNRQNIFDWWQLRNYQAPTAVTKLADQVAMTPYARKVFYVNRPSIADKPSFNKSCTKGERVREATIVLGCYQSNQAGIFVLGVTDPRLNGVEQVTAAHEMLHAAYDRLSSKQKRQIDKLLLEYYRNELKDQRILDTIDAYKKSAPSDVVNEMHSIFATEIPKLPAALEDYYKEFFTDRSQVVNYAAQYQAVFTSRQAALERDAAVLADLKKQINAAEADLKNAQATINAEQQALLGQRDGGDIAAYNAAVPAYNRLVNDYNAQVERLQGLISQFNLLVAQHNALVQEQSQLINELNSKAAPIKL